MALGSCVSANDNVALSALHDRKQFLLFRVGHIELGHGVIEILAESVPLTVGNLEMLMRLAHRAT